jgi:hypothetical protein
MPRLASAAPIAEQRWRLPAPPFFQGRAKTFEDLLGRFHGPKMMTGEKHEKPEQSINSPGCS